MTTFTVKAGADAPEDVPSANAKNEETSLPFTTDDAEEAAIVAQRAANLGLDPIVETDYGDDDPRVDEHDEPLAKSKKSEPAAHTKSKATTSS